MGAVAIFKGKLVKFLAKAGILVPKRAEADRSLTPDSGELAFNTDSSKLEVYDGTSWVNLDNAGKLVHPTVGSTVEYGANLGLTGVQNTIIGVESSNNLVDGSSNTSFGYRAAYKMSPGAGYNTAIGTRTLDISTITPYGVNSNTVIGIRSLDGDNGVPQGVSLNVAIGRYALGGPSASSQISSNIAIGDAPLYFASGVTSRNIALGEEPLTSPTNAEDNIAIGRNSLNGGINASNDNTAVGKFSLKLLTSGSNNTAVGSLSGQSLTTGSYNTLINGNTGASSSGAVAIGTDSSGTQAVASANNDYVLGTNNHRYKLPGIVKTGLKVGQSTNDTSYVTLQSDTTGSPVTWTLPVSNGLSGQCLSTDGTGTLSWATVAGTLVVSGPITLAGTYNQNVIVNGNAKFGASTVINGNLYINGGTLTKDTVASTLTVTGNLYSTGSVTLDATVAPVINGNIVITNDGVTKTLVISGSSPAGQKYGTIEALSTDITITVPNLSINFNDIICRTLVFNGLLGNGTTVNANNILSATNITTNGLSIVAKGDLSCSNGEINTSRATYQSGSITVSGNLLASTVTTTTEDNNINSTGNITVYGYANILSINTSAGWITSVTSDGAAGGNVLVRGNFVSNIVRLSGGAVTNSNGNGGNGGNLTVYGNANIQTTFETYGGSAAGISRTGGNGGSLDIRGNLFCPEIITYGGNAINGFGGSGGTLYILGSIQGESANLRGGTSASGNIAGRTGIFTIIQGGTIGSITIIDGSSGTARTDTRISVFGGNFSVNSLNIQNRTGVTISPTAIYSLQNIPATLRIGTLVSKQFFKHPNGTDTTNPTLVGGNKLFISMPGGLWTVLTGSVV